MEILMPLGGAGFVGHELNKRIINMEKFIPSIPNSFL